MRANNVKRAIRQGGTALGTMVFEFATSGMGRIAAAAGADFVILDMEHSGWGLETVRSLMAAWRADSVVPMVRVPTAEYDLLSRPLDLGAMGLMIPLVETEEQARFVVQSAKYPPVGKRGAAFGVAHDDYRGSNLLDTMRSANEETLLIALIETARGVEEVDRIAQVDGIDVLWIGHFDLTNSMGIPGQFTHPDYLRARDRVVEACHKYDKAAGFMASSAEEGQALLSQGFRCLAYWGDIWIYRTSLHSGLTAIREGARRPV